MIHGFTHSLSKPVVMILFITAHIYLLYCNVIWCAMFCSFMCICKFTQFINDICFTFCDYFYIHWLLQPCMDQMECKNKDGR
jgi:hypothetical protein